MGMNVGSRLAGWTPYRLDCSGPASAEPTARWCWTDGIMFSDPFFDQTIERCFRDPARLLFQQETTMSEVDAWADASPGLSPAGLIFHASRCGSTLVSQMLAARDSTVVLSEASPLDAVVRADAPEDDRIRWLRGLVSALGQARRPEDRHLVIKLDAWALFHLPLIRRAFPDTPAVFVYRDPIDILQSHRRRRGYHMIPGTLDPALIGLGPDEPWNVSPEEFMAIVLARLFGAALASSLLLVEYSELPGAVTETIAPSFGMGVDPAERLILDQVATRDAKNPFVPFVPVAPRDDPALLAAAEKWVQPLYEALERRRCR